MQIATGKVKQMTAGDGMVWPGMSMAEVSYNLFFLSLSRYNKVWPLQSPPTALSVLISVDRQTYGLLLIFNIKNKHIWQMLKDENKITKIICLILF